MGGAAEQASSRFLGAVEQLETRIRELESSLQHAETPGWPISRQDGRRLTGTMAQWQTFVRCHPRERVLLSDCLPCGILPPNLGAAG